ncbi:glycerophosphodiester phosphodiesterase family protein [Sphingobacterium psychroaquaticum]|uniref:glycerophosphodiester phosphodiesterase family protein n=1 Tax=Sphingobacterium psychroaquaticum TaxID=561061 RepID=UPI001F105E8F|nr:glycerophosphodiester phosphodiesterase family protein [Sphingobacterium psychroaquaticum]
MRRLSYFICLSLTLLGAGMTTTKAQSTNLRATLASSKLHYAAHRGAHRQYPENSLAAIEEAIALGATVVEVDVRATKDGVLVLMHDKTVDRTTTGKGKVSDLTFAELQKLRLRQTANGAASDHKIPTLEEAFVRSKGRIIMDLDFKEERREFVKQTYDLIAQEGMEDGVLFFMYDYKDMGEAYALNPKITLFPRARSMKELKKIMRSKMTFIAHIDESFQKNDKLMALHKKDFYLWINTLGEVDEQARTQGAAAYHSFLEQYPFVQVIQTDNPEIWKTVLKR